MRFIKPILLVALATAGVVHSQDNPPTGVASAQDTSNINLESDFPQRELNGSPVYYVCNEKHPAHCAMTPPKMVHSPQPKYSKEAKKKKIEGTAVLWLNVGVDGLPHNIRVQRSVGYGLDEQAIESVKKWKFKPAEMDGHAVPVRIAIEVEFRLFDSFAQ